MFFTIRELNIPKNRIAVLIGRGGETKKSIEKSTDTKIQVDEYIVIHGDLIGVMTAESIIKAIGRGFSPANAMRLLDEENTLDIIQLPSDKASLKRIRSRLIGSEGRARRNIEKFTHTKISIYGKTAAIIGSYDDVEKAKDALEKLVSGARHKSVYKHILKR